MDKKEKKIICLCDESVFGIESVPEVDCIGTAAIIWINSSSHVLLLFVVFPASSFSLSTTVYTLGQ